MEFDYLGSHCSVSTCKQKDFLPYFCCHCKRSLCHEHRTFEAHGCSGGLVKDMSSLECPLCKLSVKLSADQDPNEVWNAHFVGECRKSPSNEVPIDRCCKPNCATKLGPSNKLRCGKCHKIVCISHRVPEDHSCISITKQSDFLDKYERKSKVIVHNGQVYNRQAEVFRKPAQTKQKVQKTVADPSNTLKGSASRRIEAANKAAGTSNSDFTCPFCGIVELSSSAIMDHVAAFHSTEEPTKGSGLLTASDLTQGSVTNREMCPVCQQRFNDAIALVSHFESAHPQSPAATSTRSPLQQTQHSGTSDCRPS